MSREGAAAWSPETRAVTAWIERSVGQGARVVRVEAQPPTSTTQHVFEVALPDGSTRRFVLRRYHDRERLARDPWYVPAHEAMALECLASTPVPAPRLYATDLDAAVHDVPALLESWLPGQPAWRPDDVDHYLDRTARVLVAIHAVSVTATARLPSYAPYCGRESLSPPDVSARGELWERVIAALDRPRPAHRATFIHRDYHPGNILWQESSVTGVVDWATAALGPPGIDLARMRLNLAIHLGRDVADRFVAAYSNAGGDPAARDPYWDLLDAADVLPDIGGLVSSTDGGLARLEDYVAGVLADG